MANINLSPDSAVKEPMIISKGMFMVIGVLVLVLIAYGAAILLNEKFKGEVTQTKAIYGDAYDKLTKGDASEVADFQNRLDISNKVLSEADNIPNNLAEIEKAMIPAIHLDSYEYNSESSSITLICVGDNYNAAAKQMLSFKNSAYFAGVRAGETTFDSEKNKVNFTVTLTLK